MMDFNPVNFGLPRPFRSQVRLRHMTDRHDRHRPSCNGGPGHKARFPSKRNTCNAIRCVRCVNENRKHLIGCFDDWLFGSTIPIGWHLRALRLNGNRFYAMFFACIIAFLAHFSYAIDCVACVAFGWKPGLIHVL